MAPAFWPTTDLPQAVNVLVLVLVSSSCTLVMETVADLLLHKDYYKSCSSSLSFTTEQRTFLRVTFLSTYSSKTACWRVQPLGPHFWAGPCCLCWAGLLHSSISGTSPHCYPTHTVLWATLSLLARQSGVPLYFQMVPKKTSLRPWKSINCGDKGGTSNHFS